MSNTNNFLKPDSLWSGLDVQALLEGTKGDPRSVLQADREHASMPAHLQPNVKGLSVLRQISRIWGAYVLWSFRRAPSDDDSPERQRVKRIAKFYADLRAAGYMLDDVTGLKRKHLEAWLDIVRSRGYAPGTIRQQWGWLVGWVCALGKGNMIGPIEDFWPDAPEAPRSEKRSPAERHKQLHGDPRVHAELLRAKERTHWYIEQLCYRLHLDLDEAVRFSPTMVGDYGSGQMKVRTGDAVRIVAVPASEQALVQEVIEFIFRENRKTLAWPNKTPGAAARKHQQRLTYLRGKLQKEDAGEASVGGGAVQEGGWRDSGSGEVGSGAPA